MTAADAIAVVGMACRFPCAPSVGRFWQNLLDAVDAVHDYTDADLEADGIEPELRRDPAHVKAGGRLDGVADFDADFFNMTAQEAAQTDPQQRLFIETAWQALEDAGCDPVSYPGTIGVFAGSSVSRYFLFHLFGRGDVMRADWEGRIPALQSPDYLPAQVAYRLGLTGPAIAVQTACSTSLVSVCLAAQNLADYRCDVALAGGVSVTWPRHRYKPGGLVSPDGRCRAFDAAALGSGFGSGSGTVVLKRLEDAEQDRDHIYAVLAGWAVTNDGRARTGFAVPGIAGQAAAVTEAMAAAEVGPDDIGFVEAHAGGTPLGDAIEVAGLTRAYRAAGATQHEQCALGAVKSSISNLDAAAGVAGLIKAVLACSESVIPPNLHFSQPHPDLRLPGSPFFVPTKTVRWDTSHRIAGVSSIGLGGTNAHVVVTSPPPRPAAGNLAGPCTLPLSARTPAELRAVAGRLRAWLAEHQDTDLADVAYTLAEGRRRFECTASVSVHTIGEAMNAMARIEAGELPGDPPAGTEQGGRKITLPGYPLAPRRHWIEPLP